MQLQHNMPALQQQIEREKQHFKECLRKDFPFWKLKEIRLKIKELERDLRHPDGEGSCDRKQGEA